MLIVRKPQMITNTPVYRSCSICFEHSFVYAYFELQIISTRFCTVQERIHEGESGSNVESKMAPTPTIEFDFKAKFAETKATAKVWKKKFTFY